MFPTEDLIEKLKNIQASVVDADSKSLELSVMCLRGALYDVTQSLIEYYEWKKKPFMDGASKELPK